MQGLLVFALALASSFGWANWVLVSENDTGTAYVDSASVSKDGFLRRFWELLNLNVPDKDGDRSYRMLMEVDCKERRYRYLQGSYFSRPMGLGEMTGSFNKPTEWSHSAPGTTCEAVVRFVCSDTSQQAPADRRARGSPLSPLAASGSKKGPSLYAGRLALNGHQRVFAAPAANDSFA